jgi:hypothetical protein
MIGGSRTGSAVVTNKSTRGNSGTLLGYKKIQKISTFNHIQTNFTVTLKRLI